MSYPRRHGHKGRVYLRCHYCRFERGYVRVGLHLGKCVCGSGRGFNHTDDETVACFRCGKVSERITARVKDEREAERAANAEILEHTEIEHRPQIVVDRINEIERDARYAMRHGQLVDDDSQTLWKTHELAIEYRALMREWWALPAVAQRKANIPQTEFSLTSRGQSRTDSFGSGRRRLIAHAKKTGLRRFNIESTEYRLWFDEPTEKGTE